MRAAAERKISIAAINMCAYTAYVSDSAMTYRDDETAIAAAGTMYAPYHARLHEGFAELTML